jgi:hypothetical protein
MGPLMGEMMQAGIFIAGEGLRPSSLGVRLTLRGGMRTITPGPFTGANELIDRYLIIRVTSIDEAIEWAARFAGTESDAELDIRPVTEPWDLGFMPRPAGEKTTRFMILHKADSRSEAGARAALGALADEMTRSGLLLAREELQPSSRGVRLKFSGGKKTIVDGPFTESKELVAGFSITNLGSIEEAVQWAEKFAKLIGDVEIDIRPLYDQEV